MGVYLSLVLALQRIMVLAFKWLGFMKWKGRRKKEMLL